MTTEDRPVARLDDTEVARVLQRAVELDEQQGGFVDVEELRQIAGEAGISMDSLDRALEEVRLARITDTAPAGDAPAQHAIVDVSGAGPTLDGAGTVRSRIVDALYSAGMITAGVTLGAVGAASNGRMGLVTLLAGIAISLENLRRHRRTGSQWRFQLDNLWFWTAFLAGVLMSARFVFDEVLGATFLAWGSLAVFGGRWISKAASHASGFFKSLFRRGTRADAM